MPATSERLRTGRPLFIFVGDHPAVDFANTLLMVNGQVTDYLRTWTDVVQWLSRTGLSVDPSLKLAAARCGKALENVAELRQAWKAELACLIAGRKVSDEFVERLNRRLAADIFYEKLHRQGKKRFHLVRSISQLRGEQLTLAILGRQIAVFLAQANLNYLRRCANTTSCALYFYDTTKNHRRQWCSVTGCGNRHKVAEFRKRQAANLSETTGSA